MPHNFVKIPRKQRKKMGDLHSIAYCGNLHTSSLGWDYFHNNLGLLNTDFSHYMESSTPSLYSSSDSDISTGYLEDALFEFNSKRRRMLFFSGDQTDDDQSLSTHNNPIWNNWNPNYNEEISYDFKLDDLSHVYCVDNIARKCIDSNISEEEKNMKKIKTAEETNIDSSWCSQSKSSVNTKCISDKESPPTCSYEDERNKKRVVTRVVYPFAMVKPGGFEGDITLNDINRRILMPPTRSIKHPVGDFACRPLVSPDGPGLSGKEVVALTRIQTQGRGTITIIRTKG